MAASDKKPKAAKPEATQDTAAGQVDTTEWERGYRGNVPDPTPNSAYTLAGAAAGAPTPETIAPGEEGATKKAALGFVNPSTGQPIDLGTPEPVTDATSPVSASNEAAK